MKNKKNLKINKMEETNEFFQTGKGINGGGYSQPLIEGEYDGYFFTLHDPSCGEFGHRFSFEIDGYQYHYDGIGREEYESSDIPQKYSEAIKVIGEELGFRFFTKEELK